MKGYVQKGSIQKRENRFIARYYYKGHELTKRCKTEEEAGNHLIAWYQSEKGNSLDPRDWSKNQPLSFENQVQKYLERKQSRRSITHIRRHLHVASEYFGNQNVKTIGFAQLDDYLLKLEAMGYSSKTVSNYMGSLRAFFKWVCKRERIDFPEWPEYDYDLKWRNITDKETQAKVINELYKIAPTKVWLFVLMLASYPDVRPIELLHVKEEDIKLDLGMIVIKHNKIPKQYKRVYLLDEDIEMIRSMPKGFPQQYFFRHPPEARKGLKNERIRYHDMMYWWKKACDNIGLKGVSLYPGTRHTTVTCLGQEMSPDEVRYATGHSTDKAFLRYFYVDSEKKKAISRIARTGVVPVICPSKTEKVKEISD